MGYGTRSGGIQTFEPDNDENTLYLMSGVHSLEEMLEVAKEHFGPNISINDLKIEAEHIHTDCLGYDRYDSGDYTDYIVIRRF